jgi:hypothetical protein
LFSGFRIDPHPLIIPQANNCADLGGVPQGQLSTVALSASLAYFA